MNTSTTEATTSARQPGTLGKRRRNASSVWTYIDMTTRNCTVDHCTKSFNSNTASTSLIYHLNSDHQITINDDTNLDDVSRSDESEERVEIAGYLSKKITHITKHGAKAKKERDNALLVNIK
jgi:hypothetical protein